MILKSNMTLKTFDLQLKQSIEFSVVECLNYKDNLVSAISFDISDDDYKEGPNVTCFDMSVEDAKVLHSWLGTILKNK